MTKADLEQLIIETLTTEKLANLGKVKKDIKTSGACKWNVSEPGIKIFFDVTSVGSMIRPGGSDKSLFGVGISLVAMLTNRVLHSVNHVGFALSDGSIIHATTGKGVVRESGSDVVNNATNYVIVNVGGSESDLISKFDQLKKTLYVDQDSYDWKGIVRQLPLIGKLLARLKWSENKPYRFFCSELVANLLVRTGVISYDELASIHEKLTGLDKYDEVDPTKLFLLIKDKADLCPMVCDTNLNKENMNESELKQLVNEVICESGELAVINTNKLISKSATLEDFMKTLVGKKLKGLLDATSYARLYILNKYGVGSHPDENDVQANVATLMDNITAFINFRKLDGLGKHRDAWEKEQHSKPEYKEWLKQRTLAFKAYRDARDSNSSDAEELRKKYQTVVSSDPTLPDYRKMMADKETLVNQFHNTPLTVDDVLPGPDDTESDKKRWSAVEKSFNKLKNMNESTLKQLVKEAIQELREEASTKELQKLGFKPIKSDVNETGGYESEEHPDEKLIKWLEKRLAKYLPMDDYQRPALLKLLAKLKGELKKG